MALHSSHVKLLPVSIPVVLSSPLALLSITHLPPHPHTHTFPLAHFRFCCQWRRRCTARRCDHPPPSPPPPLPTLAVSTTQHTHSNCLSLISRSASPHPFSSCFPTLAVLARPPPRSRLPAALSSLFSQLSPLLPLSLPVSYHLTLFVCSFPPCTLRLCSHRHRECFCPPPLRALALRSIVAPLSQPCALLRFKGDHAHNERGRTRHPSAEPADTSPAALFLRFDLDLLLASRTTEPF